MTKRSQQVLREALELSAPERADVAAELIASLDTAEADLTAVEKEWAVEVERRARKAIASETKGTSWEDARQRAEANLVK